VSWRSWPAPRPRPGGGRGGGLSRNELIEARLIGAPGADELSLMLRGFLIRLTALDGQLEDNRGVQA